MELIEVAPGIDLEKEIQRHMDFKPIIKGTPALMDERIFSTEPMGLKEDLFAVSLEKRLVYDKRENLFSVKLSVLNLQAKHNILG